MSLTVLSLPLSRVPSASPHSIFAETVCFFLRYRAVLADIMKTQEAFWVTKDEWEEQGVRALDKLGPRE